MRKTVDHKPVWVPAQLPVDADGNTRPGFVCVHVLENGGGTCGGSVFDPAEGVGSHTCVVDDPNWLFPANRPVWLGRLQSWPCGSCGTEQDDSGPHSCVPAANAPPPAQPMRSGQKCGDPYNCRCHHGCDIP